MDDAQRIARIEQLLDGLESAAGESAADLGLEAVGLVVELYGEGLRRIAERVDVAPLVDDELVRHLLLLHGLHPVPVEQRVREALDEVRPYLESHGGGVELVGVDGDTVRISLRGSCSGCPSSAVTLKLAVEDAIRKAAPEVERIDADEAVGLPQAGAPTRWAPAGGLPQLNGGGKLVQRIAGERLLFVKAADQVYAYRPECAVCGESLAQAELAGAELRCAQCGTTYDVAHAGRADGDVHLDPVPLLVGKEGLVQVAVGA